MQVPLALGSVIPEIDSMRDDLPALWEPITAIMGRSISACTLSKSKRESRHQLGLGAVAHPVACNLLIRSSICRRLDEKFGSAKPTAVLSCKASKVSDVSEREVSEGMLREKVILPLRRVV